MSQYHIPASFERTGSLVQMMPFRQGSVTLTQILTSKESRQKPPLVGDHNDHNPKNFLMASTRLFFLPDFCFFTFDGALPGEAALMTSTSVWWNISWTLYQGNSGLHVPFFATVLGHTWPAEAKINQTFCILSTWKKQPHYWIYHIFLQWGTCTLQNHPAIEKSSAFGQWILARNFEKDHTSLQVVSNLSKWKKYTVMSI